MRFAIGQPTLPRYRQPRGGMGAALPYLCVWVFAALLYLCWWTAKVLVVGTVVLVGVVVAWVSERKTRRE